MKNYTVQAINSKGQNIKEVLAADSVAELLQMVKSRQLYLLDYTEAQSSANARNRLRVKSLVVYCRQLGAMVSSGISLIQALDMLQSKSDSLKSRKIFRAVYEEVQKGNSLSKAMELQQGAFPLLLLNMVLAGEIGGSLDDSLTRMATHYEKEQKLNNKVKSASIYPMILGIISVAVVLMLVMFVLPTITKMFDPALMPWTTKLIIGFSDFLIAYWWVIALVIIFGTVIFMFALTIHSVRVSFDKIKLYLPIIGKVNQTVYSARCARTMASLYASGVQTIQMLEITAKVLNNAYVEDLFFDVITEVSKGELISKAIADTKTFDPMLSSMIYVGEESGTLGKILLSTADYLDDEADSAIQRLLALIEPIMLVVLGVVIGFIVVSIIQPIYTTYGSIS